MLLFNPVELLVIVVEFPLFRFKIRLNSSVLHDFSLLKIWIKKRLWMINSPQPFDRTSTD